VLAVFVYPYDFVSINVMALANSLTLLPPGRMFTNDCMNSYRRVWSLLIFGDNSCRLIKPPCVIMRSLWTKLFDFWRKGTKLRV